MYRKIIYKLIYEKGYWHSRFLTLLYYFHPDIKIGKNVFIGRNVKIACEWGGKIIIGDNTKILDGVILCTYGNDILIGEKCTINPYTIIYGQGVTQIGNNVLIAAHNMIVSQNHKFDRNSFIRDSGSSEQGILIDDNVWIAHGCSILDGVKISKGSVIAAGSVLNKSTDEYSVWAGVPAKKIKNY